MLQRDRPVLFKNMRDGSFKDLAAELGLVGPGPFTSAAAGDVNKDGYTDFFLGGQGASSLALSDGRGALHGRARARRRPRARSPRSSSTTTTTASSTSSW